MMSLTFGLFTQVSGSGPLGPLVYSSGTVLAIVFGSHRGNIPMKFESHWPKGSGKVSFKANYSRFSIFSSGGHFVH